MDRAPLDADSNDLDKDEKRMLSLIGRGCWSREIAQELAISPQAAAERIQRIEKRLGVRGRFELWRCAMRLQGN